MKLNNAVVKRISINGKQVTKLLLNINGISREIYNINNGDVIDGVNITINCDVDGTKIYLCSIEEGKAYSGTVSDGKAIIKAPAGNYYVIAQNDGYRDVFEADPIEVSSGGLEYTMIKQLTAGKLFTDYHLQKEELLIDSIKDNPTDWLAFGQISDLHGQVVPALSDDGSKEVTVNVDSTEACFAHCNKIIGRLNKLGVDAKFIIHTGDVVGRTSKGTQPSSERSNENYEDLIENLEYIKKYQEAYSIKYDSKAIFVYSSGNHDARAYKVSGKTFDDALEYLSNYNKELTFESNNTCSSYYLDENNSIIWFFPDMFGYTDGDTEKMSNVRDLIQSLKSRYPNHKWIFACHQPIVNGTKSDISMAGAKFYEGIQEDDLSITGSSQYYDLPTWIGAENIICMACGHQHAQVASVNCGFPIQQQQATGQLLVNDGGTHRHNFYNASERLGYTADSFEITRNTPAKYTFQVWLINKNTMETRCITLGTGPDVIYERDGDECKITNLCRAVVTEFVDVAYVVDIVAKPIYNNENSSDFLKIGGSAFHRSAYPFEAKLINKDGIVQCPFVPKDWWWTVAYYINMGNENYSLSSNQKYAPVELITKPTIISNKYATIEILTDDDSTVILNGEECREIRVPLDSVVSYTVSKDGYFTETGEIEATYNILKKVELEEIREQRIITVVPSTGGSIKLTPSREGNSYNDGTLITVTPVPDAEYKLTKITLSDGTEYTDTFQFTITEDVTITAQFEADNTPWIDGASVTVQGIEVKYAFFQCDSKLSNIDFTSASTTFPEDWEFPYCMFCWIENPLAQGLTSLVQYGQSGTDYSYRANYSNYEAVEVTEKLVDYSQLTRGSSYGQDANKTLEVTSGSAIVWCHKISASNPDNTYFTPTGRFWTRLANKWVFNKA